MSEVNGLRDLNISLIEGLAGFAHRNLDEHAPVVLDQGADFVELACPCVVRKFAPALTTLSGFCNKALELGFIGHLLSDKGIKSKA